MLRQYELRLITQAAACQILRVSPATFFRYLKKLGEGGIEALKHGNTGKRPHNRMEESRRSRIVDLISTKYCDFQPALICKYLLRDEGIDVSEEFIRRIVKAQDPVTRNVLLEEAHPLRRRRNRFGELIQIDGSPHHWFGNTKEACCLLAFIDDASSKITAAGFFPTETAAGYLRLIKEHVLRYGIPLAFYSDRHSIFAPVNAEDNEGDGTQFQRVCGLLGIESILALTPQAKGRVERLNQTLQGRWPKEFKLRGVGDITTANNHIEEFINEFNEEFAVEPLNKEDAHVPLSKGIGPEDIRRICSPWETRILSKQLTCSYKNLVLQIQAGSKQSLRGKEVKIVEYDTGELEVIYAEKLLPFKATTRDQLKTYEPYKETSKTIDHRLDEIGRRELDRRAVWIAKRLAKAKKALELKEEILQAAEEVSEET